MDDARRIPCLDGLRALSIACVVVGHLTGMHDFQVPAAVSPWFLGLGGLGVRVFFVISGYLITGLLTAELSRSGTVRLPRFYFRRTMRLMPALAALLVVVALLQGVGVIALEPGDLLHAATYTMNYHQPHAWWLAHTWSLAVEEQFYLLWPALLVLLGRRAAFVLAGVYVLLAPLVRVGSWVLLPESRDGIGHTFPTVADAIATGCLLAGLRPWLEARPLVRRLLDGRGAWLLLAGTLASFAATARLLRVELTVGPTLLDAGIALCMLHCLRHPRGRLGRVLDARPLVVVGIGSYSIYLWQQLFLARSGGAGLLHTFPLDVVAVGAAAALSYFLVERPCLRLRQRLEPLLFGARGPRPAAEASSSA